MVDGHWDGSGDWSALIFVPSVDELQEFKVQSNTFSPQYGWSMGNAINAITKSATNQFHGGVFEFLRNGHLDANDFFANRSGLERPLVHRNQFGFNLGGPVAKDRLFLFGSYEGLRQQTPLTSILSIPTLQQRQGDFSGTFNPNGTPALVYNPFTTRRVGNAYVRDAFPGNRIPAQMFDPVALKLLPYWPQPNRAGNALTRQENYVGAIGLPVNSDQYTLRTDQNLTDNQRMFVRWSQKRQDVTGTGAYFGADNPGGMGVLEPNPRWDAGLGYNYALSPALVLSATLGWNRWVQGARPQGVPFQPSKLGLPVALDNFSGLGGFPSIGVDGMYGLGSGGWNDMPRETRTYALDLTKVTGPHTLSLGFMAIDFRYNRFNTSVANFTFPRSFTQGPDPTRADPLTGNGVASLLLGAGTGGGVSYLAHPAFQKSFYGWYFNDDFKLRRNLTLNLGLRYDFQKAPTDRFDRLTYWVDERTSLNTTGALRFTGNGNPRGVYDPQYTNLAPRVGFTWSPFRRLVVRSGFGMFYMPAMEFADWQGLALNGYSQNTPFVGSIDGITPQDLLRNPFPNGFLPPDGRALGDRNQLGLGPHIIERLRPTPYVEQWTFSLQYQLDSNTLLEAAYVGNHGLKLPFGGGSSGVGIRRNQLRPEYLSLGNALLEQVPNPYFGVITTGSLAGRTVTRGQLLRPYPQFTGVNAVQTPAGMSNYNALQLSANRRFAKGLQFLVSFTASKYLTNTEGSEGWTQGWAQNIRNYYDLRNEKSLMINDIPRSLVISYIYELPFARRSRAFGGWQLAGISTFKSGFPLAIGANTNNTNSYGGNQRPNIVADPRVDHPTVDRWFNTAAFVQPRPFTFGDAPRTLNVRAHGTNNWDFSLQKYWRLWNESSKLQFRWEAFNLFNRTGLYAPIVGLGNPSMGRVTQAMPARSMQFGMKLYW